MLGLSPVSVVGTQQHTRGSIPMTRLKKIILAAVVALVLATGAVMVASTDPAMALTRKVNEYEGQHRIAMNYTKIKYE
jgi:hypothetical protein